MNSFETYTFTVKKGTSIISLMPWHKNIYSYIVKPVPEQEAYLLKVTVCENDKYNTISLNDMRDDIFTVNHNGVFYKQPAIAIQLEVFAPYMRTLAQEMHEHWNNIEYDDLLQMCSLVMVTLYNKGMYIHKALLRKSFFNYVCVYLRHDKNKPVTVSFEKVMNENDSGDEDITLADRIVDKQQEEHKQDEENDELMRDAFDVLKDILLDTMSERQFEQFTKEYTNKHTNPWACRKMVTVRQYLEKNGITYNTIIDYVKRR